MKIYERMSKASDEEMWAVLNELDSQTRFDFELSDAHIFYAIALFGGNEELREYSMDVADRYFIKFDLYTYGISKDEFTQFWKLATDYNVDNVKRAFLYFFSEKFWRDSIFFDLTYVVNKVYRLIAEQKYVPKTRVAVPPFLKEVKFDLNLFNPIMRDAVEALRQDAQKSFGETRKLYVNFGDLNSESLTFASEEKLTTELVTSSFELEKESIVAAQVIAKDPLGWVIIKNPTSLRGLQKVRTSVESLTEKQAKDELAKLRVISKNSKSN